MDNIYRDIILDHYKHPRNFGVIANPDKSAESYNATCGDRIRFDLKLDTEGKITQVKFSGTGCAVSIAAASMLSEKVEGKKFQDISKFNGKLMVNLIGADLTPSRVKCATLPLEVLTKALVK